MRTSVDGLIFTLMNVVSRNENVSTCDGMLMKSSINSSESTFVVSTSKRLMDVKVDNA